MAEFTGFDEPEENWSKLPHQLIEALPLVTSEGELKIILYILRHTWGYQDERKRITLDEFANGRKNKEGKRIDAGTGLTIPTIRDGLKRAIEHGFIVHEQDAKDAARVKNFYSLKMQAGEKVLHPDCKKLSPRVKESLPRSEKETLETNQEKENNTPPFSENPVAGLPVGTDAHQRAVDKANGSTTPDPVEQVAKHLYWGFMGAPGLDLPYKERKKWIEAARRLLDGIPPSLDVRVMCAAIDRWWASELDQFWKDKPCNAETIDLIRKFAVNGGTHAPHQRPDKKDARNSVPDTLSEEQRRVLARYG